MITAFYTAAVGTVQIQKGFDVVANNISNIQTNGYRKQLSSFSDLLYTNIRASETDTNLKVGHGAKLKKTDNLHRSGSYLGTDRMMDYAINGNGFFAIQDTEGNIRYTRNGNFQKSLIDGQTFLTAANGGYVLDPDGQPIEILTEDEDGKPIADNASHNIGIYTFDNIDGLSMEAGLFFTANDISGEAKLDESSILKQGFLESSNVEMADAMSDIIQMQRAFQFNSRMVQIADDVMQTINSLR